VITREQKLWTNSPCLKNHCFFGINFTARKVSGT